MRRLLLALPFALLPLAASHAATEHGHTHDDEDRQTQQAASLAAHEHGAAQLNVALSGNTLELALESPAMNIVGFEHAASSASDRAVAANAKQQLQDPLALFGIAPSASCTVTTAAISSPLFASAAAETTAEHNDVDADYQLSCSHPEHLQGLDLSELFKRFPGTQKIQTQLIGRNGQQGAALSPANPRLSF